MNARMTGGMFLAALALIGFQAPATSAGVITNGDFSSAGIAPDPFAGWSTDTDVSGFIAPVDGGGVASFTITAFSDAPVHLFQKFSLPIDATTLSFELLLSSVDGGTSDGFFPDSFQASLFRASDFQAQFPIDVDFLPAFYAIDADGSDFLSSGVSTEDLTAGWKRVTLDVISLAADDYFIDFLLLGDDDSRTTTVLLDNVMVARSGNVVPEPASVVVWTMLAAALLPLSRRSPLPMCKQSGLA